MGNDIKLYLGCGPFPIHPQHMQVIDDTWILCDLYIDDPKIKKMDLRKIEYPDESVSQIYSSHALEHIGQREVEPTLKEWFRALKSGGEVIINVPDFDFAVNQYIGMRDDPSFVARSPVFNTKAKVIEIIMGNQDHEGEFHKSVFNQKGLKSVLEEVGFVDVIVKVIYEAHEMDCIVAKGKKP